MKFTWHRPISDVGRDCERYYTEPATGKPAKRVERDLSKLMQWAWDNLGYKHSWDIHSRGVCIVSFDV
jgi:hypothetical protein